MLAAGSYDGITGKLIINRFRAGESNGSYFFFLLDGPQAPVLEWLRVLVGITDSVTVGCADV